jgi:integrase
MKTMARQKGVPTRYPGVIRLPDGRYQLRWKAPCPKTGRLIEQAPIVEAPSATAAARMRDDLRTTTQGTPDQRARLATYSTSWLSGKRKTLKPSTLDRYARTLAHHIVPGLGEYFIDAITHQDIVLWRDAQTAGTATVNGWLRVLKTMLADATIAYDLPRDPSARVAALSETGGEGYSEDEPNSLTAYELALFLDAARQVTPRKRWYPLLATLAFTAMRIGEAGALKWSDITDATDTQSGSIRLQRAHWRGHVGSIKTGKRRRSVPVPPELAAILSEHRRALVARQGDELTPAQRQGVLDGLEAGWVFPNDKGGPTAAQVVRKPLLAVLRALNEKALADHTTGVDHLTVHGLRRTMNNLLRQVTHGEVVRAVTGHVTERMTEHYSHVGHDEKSSAVAKVVSMVRRAPQNQSGTSGGTQPAGRETASQRNQL